MQRLFRSILDPMKRWLPILLAALAAAGLSPAETRRLGAGEVLIEMKPAGKGPDEGIGRGAIDAPLERVQLALSDLESWDEFVPFLEESDARRQKDGSVLSRQRLDLPTPLGERRFEIRARIQERSVSWAYVPGSGNIAAHRGSWTLESFGPGRTLATCRLYLDPGGGASSWAMNRATSKTLGWIFDGLRQHVRRSRYDPPPR